MSKNSDLTAFIGRLTPLHLGHCDVIARALKCSKKVVILIGSSFQARTIKNPFTFAERRDMVLSWYEDFVKETGCTTPIAIEPISDHPYSDVEWITEVQSKVEPHRVMLGEDAKVSLTGADRDSSTWYLKAFPDWETSVLDPEDQKHDFQLSATAVREIMFSRKNDMPGRLLSGAVPASTLKFLTSFMKTATFRTLCDEFEFIKQYKDSWKAAPYEPTFVTVDNVVIHGGHILLIQRRAAPGKGLWALPGGFVEPKERLKAAAIRELSEETKIKLAKAQIEGSIQDKEIFDDPDRSLRGRTFTIAYLSVLQKTGEPPKVKGADDAIKARWVPIAEAFTNPEMWFEDHWHIAKIMKSRIKD